MPELPEVETTRRGIAPHIVGKRIRAVVVRHAGLRWPVPATLGKVLAGKKLRTVERRAKYLLLAVDGGTVLLHLGMSGSLRIADAGQPPGKFDHVDIVFGNGLCLRLRDPRRFGAVLWTATDPAAHPLLRHLGPEPLGPDFTGEYLFRRARGRRRALRDFLLDGQVVAGVGNIYANEALHAAGLRPSRPAGRLTRAEAERLVKAIQATLAGAIRAGGTTLRDFRGGDDQPGYFQLALKVYGRHGQPCPTCGSLVKVRRQGGRSAFYCHRCQS